jgi:putative phosphonate catabolism associated alcohol dehydrogenase
MTVIERPRLGQVAITPSAVAMAWLGVGHRHEMVAVPAVTLGPGDLLVAIELTTLCGSDLHAVSGERRASTPLVLGHEQLGRIVAIGEGAPARAVDGTRLIVGARVVWSVTAACGGCQSCKAGFRQNCLSPRHYGRERMQRGWELSGGFASHIQVLAGTAVVVIDEEIPAEVVAPVGCATATVVAALDAATRITGLAGTTVVIAGAGLLGLTAAAMARDAGARVIVSEPDPDRRENARSFGAAAVVNPGAASGSALSLDRALRSLGARGGHFRIGLEFSGSPQAMASLIGGVDVGGVVVLAGTVSPDSSIVIDPEALVRRLVTVTGVHDSAPLQLLKAVDYLQEAWRRWPFGALVGAEVALDQLDSAFEIAAAGDWLRVGIRP